MEVEDHDPTIPAVSNGTLPTPDAGSGRGLQIVRQIADAWGVFRTEVGKVVWAEFDRIKRMGKNT